MSHQLRFCESHESGLLQDFIETSWKQGHVLAHDKGLLDWQYLNKEADRYNFIVAFNDVTGRFDAVLGFIPVAHFDPALTLDNQLWLALWKNNVENSKDSQVGLKLLWFLEKAYENPSIGILGASPIAERIYRALKFTTGRVKNYAVFNPTLDTFSIAANVPSNIQQSTPSSYRIEELDLNNPELLDIPSGFRPQKSLTYLRTRYTKHPRFSYTAYGIYSASSLKSIWITRMLKVEQASCIRLVDMYGQLPTESIQQELEKVLITENVEYIDCVHAGLDDGVMRAMGFTLREDPLILPTYFDPFEQSNQDLIYSHRVPSKSTLPYHIFKGDSDQDRPNR